MDDDTDGFYNGGYSYRNLPFYRMECYKDHCVHRLERNINRGDDSCKYDAVRNFNSI